MDSPRLASAAQRLRHVFLHDMILHASIGVHAHEHAARQRIRLNLDLAVADDGATPMSRPAPARDDLTRVVRIRVEKLDVFPDVASVGVEIERCSASHTAV